MIKEHKFRRGRIEPDGWGNHWHWRVCDRCGFATYDIKKVEK